MQMTGQTKQILDALAREAFDEALADRVLDAFYESYGARWMDIVKDASAPTDEEVNAVFAAQLWAFCSEVVAGHEIQAASQTAAEAARGKVDGDFGGVKPVEPKPVDPKGGDAGGLGEGKP